MQLPEPPGRTFESYGFDAPLLGIAIAIGYWVLETVLVGGLPSCATGILGVLISLAYIGLGIFAIVRIPRDRGRLRFVPLMALTALIIGLLPLALCSAGSAYSISSLCRTK